MPPPTLLVSPLFFVVFGSGDVSSSASRRSSRRTPRGGAGGDGVMTSSVRAGCSLLGQVHVSRAFFTGYVGARGYLALLFIVKFSRALH